MTPNWYDLLDLDPHATTEEVREAWKHAIEDLEPSDRRFRVFNEAAAVLLDPTRRADYDATLITEDPEEPGPHTVEQVDDTMPAPAPVVVRTVPAVRRRSVPTWAVVLVGLVTAGVLATTIFAWTRPEPVDERAAQSAAEAAIVPVLSFDYRHLEADAAAARSYMTAAYRKKYDQTFALVQDNAPATETVVSAEIVASGIVRTGEGRVDVLLFVNRPTLNKADTEPVVYRDQVTARMRLVGGDWLVDDLITTPAAQ